MGGERREEVEGEREEEREVIRRDESGIMLLFFVFSSSNAAPARLR